MLTGSSFSLPIPILSKADAKMMSVELPLSTKTRWTVVLATIARITSGSSWGCWHPSKSESENVIGVSTRGTLDTACISPMSVDLMLRRWAFRAELDSPPPANPPEITWISPGVAGAGSSFDEVVAVESGPGSGSGLGFEPDSPEI